MQEKDYLELCNGNTIDRLIDKFRRWEASEAFGGQELLDIMNLDSVELTFNLLLNLKLI